jgi:hypothetical protein
LFLRAFLVVHEWQSRIGSAKFRRFALAAFADYAPAVLGCVVVGTAYGNSHMVASDNSLKRRSAYVAAGGRLRGWLRQLTSHSRQWSRN